MAKKKYIVILERGVLFEVEVLAEDKEEAAKLGWEKAGGIELETISWASLIEQKDDKLIKVEEKK